MKFDAQGISKFAGVGLLVPFRSKNPVSFDKEKTYTVEIKEKRERRSLTANAYCWVLCQKIAEVLSRDGEYFNKEMIYKKAVKDSGNFDTKLIHKSAVEFVLKHWNNRGLGWLAEPTGSELGDCLEIQFYVGSSEYNKKEMARLIDCLVDECNQLGIETKSEEEINSLLEQIEGK